MLEKDTESLYFKKITGRPMRNNKQVTGVCINLLLSTVVMSLNTSYGLY